MRNIRQIFLQKRSQRKQKRSFDKNDIWTLQTPAPNIVYTKLGASGSNYSRVTFNYTGSEAQHRMPSVRIHGTLGDIEVDYPS